MVNCGNYLIWKGWGGDLIMGCFCGSLEQDTTVNHSGGGKGEEEEALIRE